METYRSGHNENDSKSFDWPKAGPWVRIPPSPNNKPAFEKSKMLAYFFALRFAMAHEFYVKIQKEKTMDNVNKTLYIPH